jgi:hypothetical protein
MSFTSAATLCLVLPVTVLLWLGPSSAAPVSVRFTEGADQPVCFLTIQYNESNYLGTLIFTHPKFYEEVCELLKRNAGRPLNEIGAMGY